MANSFLVAVLLAATVTAPSDRSIAEWVLRQGGSVIAESGAGPVFRLDELPAGEFRLHTINLVGTLVEPRELEKLSGWFT